MVFLMETRLRGNELLKIKQKTGFSCFKGVDCKGTGKQGFGGLLLLRNDDYDVTLTSFSPNHIMV